ncbi:TetR/AcrR family transcriptional regulator [Rhodococcus sp. SJ-2]
MVSTDTSATSGRSTTRPYRSPRRQLQAARTRAAVLATATELFTSRGWAGTSMRDVARAAEVSVETIYSAVGPKAALLKAAVDIAVVGDAEPSPLADRSAFIRIGAAPTRHQRIDAAARLTADINERTHRIIEVLRTGARTEPTLHTEVIAATQRRYNTVTEAARMISGRDLPPDRIDELWALTSDQVYHLLVTERGWSRARYTAWLTGRIEEILDRPE